MAEKPLYYGSSKRSSPMYYGGRSAMQYGAASKNYGVAAYGSGAQYGGGNYGIYGGNYGGGAGGAGGGEDGSLVGTITFSRMLRVVSQRWLSVFVFLLVGLIVAFAVYRISPTIYEAKSEFTMDMRRSSGGGNGGGGACRCDARLRQ